MSKTKIFSVKKIEYTIKRKDHRDTMVSYLDLPTATRCTMDQVKSLVRSHVQRLNFSTSFKIVFLTIS